MPRILSMSYIINTYNKIAPILSYLDFHDWHFKAQKEVLTSRADYMLDIIAIYLQNFVVQVGQLSIAY